MNLINLFTREELIAGLEISDSYLRLALLEIRETKKVKKTEIVALVEEPLKEGAVVNGLLKDRDSLVHSLKVLLDKAGVKVRYVILSLPADGIYSRVFYFPKTVQGQKLEETMKLTIGFQLPVKHEDVYLDWEKIEPSEQSEILLTTIPKNVVDDFVAAAELAGLKSVAVEFHPLSLSRIIETAPGETVMVTIDSESSKVISVIKDMTLVFMRALPKKFFSKEKIQEEVRKITDFYESKNGKISKALNIEEAKLKGKLLSHPKLGNESSQWLISLGAALRGLLPRAEDNLVSLMPVGTEEAYEYQKAAVFSGFISSLTIGLSILFSVVFIGASLLMVTIQQNFNRQFETLTNLPLPAYGIELENKARKFNNLVVAASKLLKSTPRWSLVFQELQLKTLPGIRISNLTINSPQQMTLTGLAQNRTLLNSFKKSLEESPLFANVNLPLTSLEQRENLNFSVSFSIKDPNLITGF